MIGLADPHVPAARARCGWLAGYRLDAVLGRGRESVVYLAVSPSGRGRVALKVGPQAQAEFVVLAELAHAHVIRGLDHGASGDIEFVAMECAAGTVAGERGALESVRTVSLFGQAAQALAWVHRRGWVHRDVKPANLLLRADGSLALGDFGSARRRGHPGALRHGTWVGSPRYAAPEQSQGASAGPAEDVYGLGVCLYEMLCGRPLYPGENAMELFSQHLMAPVPRLPANLAAWQPLLDAMLAKDPRQRAPDGQAVLRQLQRLQRNPS